MTERYDTSLCTTQYQIRCASESLISMPEQALLLPQNSAILARQEVSRSVYELKRMKACYSCTSQLNLQAHLLFLCRLAGLCLHSLQRSFEQVVCAVAVMRLNVRDHEVRESIHVAARLEHHLWRHRWALHLCRSSRAGDIERSGSQLVTVNSRSFQFSCY